MRWWVWGVQSRWKTALLPGERDGLTGNLHFLRRFARLPEQASNGVRLERSTRQPLLQSGRQSPARVHLVQKVSSSTVQGLLLRLRPLFELKDPKAVEDDPSFPNQLANG